MMSLRNLALVIVISIVQLAQAAPIQITGAGSTFAGPLYAKWIAEFHSQDASVEINYQAIGSGGGVRQFIAGTTDFGGTDDPMKDDEIKQVSGTVLHIPTAIGAVALTYNLPSVGKPLKFTGDILADIYLGKITKWDDKKIKALNPGVSIPNQPIVVAFRADGSGTTAVFTDFLSQESREWKASVGNGKSVKFPVGLGGKGNDGVTGLVRQNPGSIGYIEMTFAKINKLPMGLIKNPSGQFVEPSVDAVKAAAAGVKVTSDDLRLSILNAPGKLAYPISAFTWVIVHQEMSASKGPKLTAFLKWALDQGQSLAVNLHYGPLPEVIQKKALKAVDSMRTR
jgi:phosphate transport system substrate-binding protein